MKTYIPAKIEAITEYLEGLSNVELVAAHNQYCENNNNNDDQIFDNGEEFFETHFSNDVIGAVRAASYGEYNYSHHWVKFNGYANLISFNDPTDEITISEIAENVLENANDYGIELEEVEEEEEN